MHRYDPESDAYVTLGCDPKASAEEVEAAYRRSALTWHPDKSPAPDAAERFLAVQEAGKILRDPEQRRDYDFLRERHIGRTFRPRGAPPTSSSRASSASPPPPPPKPHAPINPPPAWLAPKVRIHMDAVLVTLETPRTSRWATTAFNYLAIFSLGGALFVGDLMLFALAAVLFAIGRVLYVPPHDGMLTWAKIVPGRRLAEFHTLDQKRQTYRRLDVAFQTLRVTLVGTGDDYRIELQGFPRAAAPVLLRTRDADEAKRCWHEAGQWFSMPLSKAA